MVDTSNTGPDAGLETQNGPEITESEEQEIISSRGEPKEQAGRVDVETEKPSGGEFPQTAPSIEKEVPSIPKTPEEMPSEELPQKPLRASEAPSEDAIVADLKADIQRIKSSNDNELGGRSSETTEDLIESRKRLAKKRGELVESGKEIAEFTERLAEKRKKQ